MGLSLLLTNLASIQEANGGDIKETKVPTQKSLPYNTDGNHPEWKPLYLTTTPFDKYPLAQKTTSDIDGVVSGLMYFHSFRKKC